MKRLLYLPIFILLFTISCSSNPFNNNSTSYSSARITTKGKHSLTYGTVKARMKLPKGQGVWPAFWLLPETGTWPDAGEIDIMEIIGGGNGFDNKLHGSVHFGDSSKNHLSLTNSTTLDTGTFNDDFHVFSVKWEQNKITWFLDDEEYYSVTKKQIEQKGGVWCFDRPFYVIFNFAMGGFWAESVNKLPSKNHPYTNELFVDYVEIIPENGSSWKEDFNTDGPIDLNDWNFETEENGTWSHTWNNELQRYTENIENCYIQDGNLIIKVIESN